MVLTPATLLFYLLDRGVISGDAVVDGDFRVLDQSRRNQAFRVASQERPDYLIKQVGDWRRSNVSTFEAEAHWYWLARNHPGFAPMVPFLSNCSGYDAESQILILDIPEKSKDLDRHFRQLGRFPAETAQLLGATLAAFHTALPDGARAELRSDFREAVPWILSLHEMSEASLDTKGPGVVELLRIVREYPGFGTAFEELRGMWHRETLINGDMKFAHCILVAERELYFIDWEMADFGDPLWDAGAILQEYLSAWLRSMPASARVPIEDLVRKARTPLEEIQPAIRAFWESYLRGRERSLAEKLGKNPSQARAAGETACPTEQQSCNQSGEWQAEACSTKDDRRRKTIVCPTGPIDCPAQLESTGSGLVAQAVSPASEEMLDRAVGYCAAWLIQSAYQSLRDAEQITTRAVRMAQLSLNILRDRAAAAHGLLGL